MMHAGGQSIPQNPSVGSLTSAGNVTAAGFVMGANVGVTTSLVIPAVATLTIRGGIITNIA